MTRFVCAAIAATALALGLSSSAPAAVLYYSAVLDGPSEDPPVASPGTGTALLVIDTTANTYQIVFDFQGLLGGVTAVHIHGPTTTPGTGVAGVMTPTPTFPDSPLGMTDGSYNRTFDMTQTASYRAGFVTNNGGTAAGAAAAFMAAVDDGKAYLNIHSSAFPGGEIRGFFQAVPEPSSVALLGLGAAGLAARFRRRARA